MELCIENKEKILSYLNVGECPICHKNGYKAILTHISRSHGISHREIKDILLIPVSKSFIPEDLKEKHSCATKNNGTINNLKKSNGKGRKHTKIQKQKRRNTRKENGDDKKFVQLMKSEQVKEKRDKTIKEKFKDIEYCKRIVKNIKRMKEKVI